MCLETLKHSHIACTSILVRFQDDIWPQGPHPRQTVTLQAPAHALELLIRGLHQERNKLSMEAGAIVVVRSLGQRQKHPWTLRVTLQVLVVGLLLNFEICDVLIVTDAGDPYAICPEEFCDKKELCHEENAQPRAPVSADSPAMLGRLVSDSDSFSVTRKEIIFSSKNFRKFYYHEIVRETQEQKDHGSCESRSRTDWSQKLRSKANGTQNSWSWMHDFNIMHRIRFKRT